MKRTILLSTLAACQLCCCAAVGAVESQTAAGVNVPATVTADSMAQRVRRHNFFDRLARYATGNESDTSTTEAMKMKWVVLGGPHYSTDSKLGLALSGMLTFRLKGCSPTEQASSLNLWGDISTAGFWAVGVSGTVLFPNDKRRVNTELRFSYSPIKFWGMGYDMADIDANETKLDMQELRFVADYVVQVVHHLYVGPAAAINYFHCSKIGRRELLEGQDLSLQNYGLGFAVHYDSRDQMNNATRGCYVGLKQIFRPRFLGNNYAFSSTQLTARAYSSPWRGGVVAGELTACFNFGNPSWAMLAQLGSNSSMRGYYNGRYRDKHMMAAQVELRQTVWRRNGIAVWAGVGNVFHDAFTFGNLLPNYGIGYRFRLRKNVVLRLDYGFGKRGHNGFVMSVNEAF